MASQVEVDGLGGFARLGFTLEHPDDRIVEREKETFGRVAEAKKSLPSGLTNHQSVSYICNNINHTFLSSVIVEIKIETSDLVTVAQAATELHKPRMTVYRWINRGKIIGIKLADILFVPKSELHRLQNEEVGIVKKE